MKDSAGMAAREPCLHRPLRLSDAVPLRYGATPAEAQARRQQDVPDHVRSASAVRRLGARLVVIQDDVNAWALLSKDGHVEPLLLPRGPLGRRQFGSSTQNKAHKLDLEASVLLPDGRLLAFGSGGLPARERLVLWRPGEAPRVIPAPALYAALRACQPFAGSELNVEGALLLGTRLWLFQRGNGALRGEKRPVNGTLELELMALLAWLAGTAPLPSLENPQGHDLGQVDGVPRGFTDAALHPSGRVCFLAAAENSGDSIADGPCLGSWLGWFGAQEIHLAPIHGDAAEPTRLKLEGLEFDPGGRQAWVVADPDDEAQPALLLRLTLPPEWS
jgi:hypothetical protein